MVKKRARALFHGKLRKAKKNQNKEENASFVIPWDVIVPVMFLLTCYGMELAAITIKICSDNDLDASVNRDLDSFRCSINKCLEKETPAVEIVDIERRLNEYKKQPFASPDYCYSHLIAQRIKSKKPKK